MKLLWLCFLTVCGSPPLPEVGELEERVGEAIKHVVGKYFSQSFCLGVIYECRNTFAHLVEGVPLVLLKIRDIPEMNSDEEAFDKVLVEFLNQKCLDVMIQVVETEAMVEHLSRTSRRSTVRSNRRYLFLPVVDDAITNAVDAGRVFAMKEMAVLPDLVIAKLGLAESNKSLESQNQPHRFAIEFVTHKYAGYHPEEEISLDTWPTGSGNSLFPDKLKNLEGKEMTIAAVPDYPPYTILDFNATPPLYEGVELRVTKDFAKLHNFSFHVLVDNDAWWGEVWPNGSGNGMWGMVAMDVAALGFGATYAWLENYPHLDFSLPYFRSSVRCITPRPRQLPGWMTPVLPFDSQMWTAVGISLGITIAALYLVTNSIMRLLGTSTFNTCYRWYENLWGSAFSWLWLRTIRWQRTPAPSRFGWITSKDPSSSSVLDWRPLLSCSSLKF